MPPRSRSPRPDSLERLWAPWRRAYLAQRQPPRCIFCASARSRADARNHVVHRGRHAFALLNRYPYNNGHLMVSPYRHVRRLADLTSSELLELMRLTSQMTDTLTDLLRPDGFNIGINLGRAAGAGIPGHLHLHVVPRWLGDTNFMPTLSQTKVISDSLDELYRQLTRRRSRR